MAPTSTTVVPPLRILDIRQGDNFDLKKEIVKGLTGKPRSLPSLLLWDDQGQKLFDQFSQKPDYYPFHSEIEVLSRHGSSIAGYMPVEGILLELGCGTIRKTKSILEGFRKRQKPVHYFALDVSREGLQDSITELQKSFADCPYIRMTGLLGTYDDGVAWLSGTQHLWEYRSAMILWLGNSITNMESKAEVSKSLGRFKEACRSSKLECRFVVSIDICQKDDKVLRIYSAEGAEQRAFLSNALDSANAALGYKAFSGVDWKPSLWLDPQERDLHCYLVAQRDILVPLPPPVKGIKLAAIQKDERVHLISSGKWSEGAVEGICQQAGFRIQQRWKDSAGDYCVFLLE